MMKPSEVIEMRNALLHQMWDSFNITAFRLDHDGQELADWLIEKGWVTEVPSEDAD